MNRTFAGNLKQLFVGGKIKVRTKISLKTTVSFRDLRETSLKP